MNRSLLTATARRAASLALFMLQLSMTHAQIDRSKAPSPGPAPRVNLGQHKTFLLPNGMRVIVVENHKLPIVGLQVKFDIDPFLEGERTGLSELAGELLATGTASHDKEWIDEHVDMLGATLSTTKDGLFASSLARNFPAVLELAEEMLLQPSFPEQEFEKARKRTLSALKSREDDPDAISEQVGRLMTYTKAHPYGEIATEKSVRAIERAHVVAYYKRFFRPEKGYIVLVGDITEAKARELTGSVLGKWSPAKAEPKVDADGNEVVEGLGTIRTVTQKPAPGAVRRVAFVEKPDAAQSIIRVAFPVDLKAADPQAVCAQVLNTILGGGVFNARLMMNLREDKGYTYGAYSELVPDRWGGHFSASASVRTEVTDSAVKEMLGEIERIREEGVSASELELAKSYLAGSFARSLEDPRTVARFALNTYLEGLPADHYATYLQRLDTVSARGVLNAAQALLVPDRAVVLVVGDKKVANSLTPFTGEPGVGYYDTEGAPWRERTRPAPEGVTADQVIQRYIEACGGSAAIEGIRDLRIEMSSSLQGMPVKMTQWYAAPNMYANSMTSGGVVLQKVVFDGQKAMSDGTLGPRMLEDLELLDVAQNAYPFPELKYKELHHELRLNGVIDVDGRQAYKVTVRTENGGQFEEYYDVESGFKLRRSEGKHSDEGYNINVTQDLKDYRPEGGVQFPHLVTQNMGVEVTFTATAIEVNKGVDRSVFRVE